MRRFILLSVTAICLIGLLYSFRSSKFSPPQQKNSTLTGSSVWHGEIQNYDQQILTSATLIPIILTFGSMIISIIFAHKKSTSKEYISYFIFPDYPTSLKNKPSNIKTISFNKKLSYYTTFVFITSLTFYILEPGKLWSTFNSLHNLIGLLIILFLTLEGQLHENKFLVFSICSTYIVLINLLIILLKWPFDYVAFKAQNLIIEFTLVILLSRIYFHTHNYVKDQKPLLPSHSQTAQTAEEGDKEEAEIKEDTANKKLKFITHPNQVCLLPLAALVQVLGSIVSYVLINNIIGNIVYLLSIAIAFSMYSFYIYLDTRYAANNLNSKNIVLPYTPTWKLLVIISWSIILSAATIRIIIFKKQI